MTAEVRVSDIMAVRETAPHLAAGFAERARAFVEVQNGCDHRCTFCIIPFGRGNSRSVPAGLVIERIAALVDEGFREVVLTGVDVTSYGPDLPGAPTLGQLIERILRHVPALPRLRLSSLDCIEMDERLFELATGEPRFMPHLHMSFQAGDDMILKRMKRRHSRADAVETVARLKAKRPRDRDRRRPHRRLPDRDRRDGREHAAPRRRVRHRHGPHLPLLAKAWHARRAHAPGPSRHRQATRPRPARGLRARARRRGWTGMVGTRQRVLVEKDGRGHAENFAPVQIRHSSESWNRASSRQGHSRFRWNDGVVDVCVTGVDDGTLIGAPL